MAAFFAGAEAEARRVHGALLEEIETTAMTRTYKMLVLRAMLEERAFPGAIALDRLAARFGRLAARNPRYRADVSADLDNPLELRRLVARYPVPAWIEADGGHWFRAEDDGFATTFAAPKPIAETLAGLVSEIVDWRLAAYLDARPDRIFETPPATRPAVAAESAAGLLRPELWQEYTREMIPPLFGETFNEGKWNAGVVTVGSEMILLVTLKKGSLSSGNDYEDRFEDPHTFHWQSQNRTLRDSRHGRMISGAEPGTRVHLFVRSEKLRNGKAAPSATAAASAFSTAKGSARSRTIGRANRKRYLPGSCWLSMRRRWAPRLPTLRAWPMRSRRWRPSGAS